MDVAVVTFDAFNELDSLIVASLLNRFTGSGVHAYITAPGSKVTSRAGLVVEAQKPLEFTAQADAVVIGSGPKTAKLADDATLMARITLDPGRQLIASQCSGALILQRLGLLEGAPACTDAVTGPLLTERGTAVLDRAFHATGNVATAGGCFASQYIAAWMVARMLGTDQARWLIDYVAPVGEKEVYVERALQAVGPYLPHAATAIPAASATRR